MRNTPFSYFHIHFNVHYISVILIFSTSSLESLPLPDNTRFICIVKILRWWGLEF